MFQSYNKRFFIIYLVFSLGKNCYIYSSMVYCGRGFVVSTDNAARRPALAGLRSPMATSSKISRFQSRSCFISFTASHFRRIHWNCRTTRPDTTLFLELVPTTSRFYVAYSATTCSSIRNLSANLNSRFRQTRQ